MVGFIFCFYLIILISDESTSSSRHRARGVHFNENDDDEQNDEDDGYEKDTRSKYKQMAKDLVAQRRQEMGDGRGVLFV